MHWAAYAGADLALSYIVAQQADVNPRDIKGLTPLHLAVKTSEDIFTTRSIRALLLKGANPRAKDLNGCLPEDFLADFDMNQPMMPEFVREIFELLQDDKSNKYNPLKECECFALNPSFKKKGKNNRTFICYFILMIAHFVVLSTFVYPSLTQNTISPTLNKSIVGSYYLFALCLICNYALSKKDPGYLTKTVHTPRGSVMDSIQGFEDDDFL